MYEITFQFENGAQEVKFSAAPGSTILEAAKSANVAIDAPCNGNGSCGKCRVKLVSGEVTGVQTGHISDEDYAAGWRLSCSTKPAGDITVLVPDIASAYQSRMKTADLSSGEEIAIFNQLQQDVQAAGVDFSLAELGKMILLSLLLTMGGGGIPGGAMVFLALIFETFGLPVEVVAVIAGIHTLNEMGLTTMNCLGDLVGTVIATFSGKDRENLPPEQD